MIDVKYKAHYDNDSLLSCSHTLLSNVLVSLCERYNVFCPNYERFKEGTVTIQNNTELHITWEITD